MILSMTGYGQAERLFEGLKISVEVKSLNSKNLDLNLQLPRRYSEKEMWLRKLASERIRRGKVFISIRVSAAESAAVLPKISAAAVAHYLEELERLKSETGFTVDSPGMSLLRLPEILISESEANDSEWKEIQTAFYTALENFEEYRKAEGKSLMDDLVLNVRSIEKLLTQVPLYEDERIDKVRQRLKASLSQLSQEVQVDEGRLEQEMIYYLEKLDINEEKVRLGHHCNYFLETIDRKEDSGKKLAFISQELGREINTIGSKANSKNIQRLVVEMKEHLEKIKEQLLNAV